MREAKRARDAEKKAKIERITGGVAAVDMGKVSISNSIIDDILNDKDPFT